MNKKQRFAGVSRSTENRNVCDAAIAEGRRTRIRLTLNRTEVAMRICALSILTGAVILIAGASASADVQQDSPQAIAETEVTTTTHVPEPMNVALVCVTGVAMLRRRPQRRGMKHS